jgi:hypothetical protein
MLYPFDMKIVARIVNAQGLTFNVRLVCKGDRYGLDDGLVHDKPEPLIEFWDATYENDPRFTRGLGQFVSRYFLGTLTGKDGFYGTDHRVQSHGIVLCGHVPAWTLTAHNVVEAITAAEAVAGRN